MHLKYTHDKNAIRTTTNTNLQKTSPGAGGAHAVFSARGGVGAGAEFEVTPLAKSLGPTSPALRVNVYYRNIDARFYELGLTRDSRVIPGLTVVSVLSTSNLGLNWD